MVNYYELCRLSVDGHQRLVQLSPTLTADGRTSTEKMERRVPTPEWCASAPVSLPEVMSPEPLVEMLEGQQRKPILGAVDSGVDGLFTFIL